MATNNLKTPFFLDRKNEPRELFSLTDVKVATPLTINGTEYATGTSLESILKTSVEAAKEAARPYKVYVAKLNQAGTANPSITVLENTLGIDLEFERAEAGIYDVIVAGTTVLGTDNSKFVAFGGTSTVLGGVVNNVSVDFSYSFGSYLASISVAENNVLTDDFLGIMVEIRAYN